MDFTQTALAFLEKSADRIKGLHLGQRKKRAGIKDDSLSH
jgi:hypothetical protein